MHKEYWFFIQHFSLFWICYRCIQFYKNEFQFLSEDSATHDEESEDESDYDTQNPVSDVQLPVGVDLYDAQNPVSDVQLPVGVNLYDAQNPVSDVQFPVGVDLYDQGMLLRCH